MRAGVEVRLDLILVVVLDRVALPAGVRRSERASLVEVLRALDHPQKIDVVRAAEIGRGAVAVVVDGIVDVGRAGARHGADRRLVHGAAYERERKAARERQPGPDTATAHMRGDHGYCSNMKPADPRRCGAPAVGASGAFPLVAVRRPSRTHSRSFANSSPSVGSCRSEALATGCTM